MASFTPNPPTAFNFRESEERTKWLTRFEQFRIASRLSTESGKRKVSSLLYCMHVYAVDVIVTTKISDHNSKVVKNFNKQFKV